MADAMGVKLKVVKLDWNGMLPGLLTDQFDIIISGMTITPQRNLWINFTDPYMTVGQTILVSRKLARKIKNHNDLNKAKYTVTTKTGTTAFEAIKSRIPKAKLRLMQSEWLGVKEVLEGRADAFVYDLPFNAVAAARYPKTNASRNAIYRGASWFWRSQNDPDSNWLNHFWLKLLTDDLKPFEKWFVERDYSCVTSIRSGQHYPNIIYFEQDWSRPVEYSYNAVSVANTGVIMESVPERCLRYRP